MVWKDFKVESFPAARLQYIQEHISIKKNLWDISKSRNVFNIF